MKILLDFSVSEVNNKLNTVLTDFRKDLEFELYNSIAEFENTVKAQTASSCAVVDSAKIVDCVVESATRKIKHVLSTPLPITIASWDTGDDIVELISEGFENCVDALEASATTGDMEVFLTTPLGQSNVDVEVVDVSYLLECMNADKINSIIKKTEEEVIGLCRQEMAYIHETLKVKK